MLDSKDSILQPHQGNNDMEEDKDDLDDDSDKDDSDDDNSEEDRGSKYECYMDDYDYNKVPTHDMMIGKVTDEIPEEIDCTSEDLGLWS